MTCWYKNREFWEVLEPVRAHETNTNGYSYICAALRELHSEKKPSAYIAHKIFIRFIKFIEQI